MNRSSKVQKGRNKIKPEDGFTEKNKKALLDAFIRMALEQRELYEAIRAMAPTDDPSTTERIPSFGWPTAWEEAWRGRRIVAKIRKCPTHLNIVGSAIKKRLELSFIVLFFSLLNLSHYFTLFLPFSHKKRIRYIGLYTLTRSLSLYRRL